MFYCGTVCSLWGTVTKPEKKETMDWLPVKELGGSSWREKEASSAIEHC